jgi:hypothetical protein
MPDTERFSRLKILPERWEARAQRWFGQIAVNNAQLRFDKRAAILIRLNDRRFQETGSRQNGAQATVWKSPALSLTTFEDKKPIIAGCNPALDAKEITQRDISLPALDRQRSLRG